MTYRSLIFLPALLLFAACEPRPSQPHGGDHTPQVTEDERLSIDDQSTEQEIAFAVRDAHEVFTDYGISHTKEMHLIIVRDDLRYFQHLHPERDNAGRWHVPFSAPAGGMYWMYADFVEKNAQSHTIRFERTYEGDRGDHGIVKNAETTVIIDHYDFTMEPTISADGIQFNYWIYDAIGADAKLEKYLGEKGHSVLISPSGDFVHTHPFKEYEGYRESDHPVFITPPLSDSFYRIFTQFQIEGQVFTVSFDWERL